ncbi:hypothetical protein D3C86_1954780 [compost metagenome]
MGVSGQYDDHFFCRGIIVTALNVAVGLVPVKHGFLCAMFYGDCRIDAVRTYPEK